MAISKPLSIIIVITIPIAIIIALSFYVLQKINTKNSFEGDKSKAIKITRQSTGSPNDKKFNDMMIDVYSMMSMAKDIFPVDTTLEGREKSLSDIKDIGIYYWNRNIEVLDSLKKINNEQQTLNKIIAYQEYCKLNKSCYELMYKAVDEHTRKYDRDIDKQFTKIAEKHDEISDKEK
ncbi:hypothetical protein D3C87_390790 [compost metagenome]